MAKQAGQKLKLLYLIQIFEENTDENGHYLTMPQIQEKLKNMMDLDNKPDRKSLYDDIEVLRDDFGLDICDERAGAKTYYYLGSRKFSLPDLRMMVDAIASSKFLTEKRTKELIKKLEDFCSPFERMTLNRQITLANRVKSSNETIHYNVNSISNAICYYALYLLEKSAFLVTLFARVFPDYDENYVTLFDAS